VFGVGDKGSGDTTMVDRSTDTLGCLFEHFPEVCLFH
jgi:hypothetical protein